MIKHDEYLIQSAIFEHHQTAFPYVKFVFIPNASKDASTGFFNKKLGLMPGAFDLHLFWNRAAIDAKPSDLNVGIWEVKSETGRLTVSQNRYASEMHELGAWHGYGYTVKEYHLDLCSWGLKPLHSAITEPDLRTKEEKFKDAYNLYKRPEV